MSFTEAGPGILVKNVIVYTAGDEDCAAGRVTKPQSLNINFSRNVVRLRL